MKYKELIDRLENSDLLIKVDWEWIETQDFIELCSHPKLGRIENLLEGLVKFSHTSSPAVCQGIDYIITQFPDFKSQLIEELNIPTKTVIKYNINSKNLTIEKDEVLPLSKFNLSEETINGLDQIETEYLEFEFNLKLFLNDDSIYNYSEKDTISEEKSIFNSSIVDSSIAASILIAASITSCALFSELSLESKKDKTNIEFSLETGGYLSSQLNQKFETFLSETHSANIDKHLPSLKAIDPKELERIVEYVESMNDIKENNLAPINSTEEMKNEIKNIITNYYNKNGRNVDIIAESIAEVALANNLDYKLMIAIIKVESSFRQDAVSRTGDLSVAQINYKTWGPEFERLGYDSLNEQKLKTDVSYAIQRMADILTILKTRHQQDEFWFARYHSSTPSLKLKYASKVQRELDFIHKNKIIEANGSLDSILFELINFKSMQANNGEKNIESLSSLITSLSLIKRLLEDSIKEQKSLIKTMPGRTLASN